MRVVRWTLASVASLVFASLITAPAARAAEPLHVYAAGSLKAAMTTLITLSGLPAGSIAPPVYGPAGLLRARIEKGETADLFASADMAQPRKLAAAHPGEPVILFAHNSMCALVREPLHPTPANLLELMLRPEVKIATSTPGADPSGDYAFAVFTRAEALRPGAKAILNAKALQLMGGPKTPAPLPGQGVVQSLFASFATDLVLSYCTGAAEVVHSTPGVVSIPLPSELTVTPAFGLVVLRENPLADRLALFILSEPGQAILANYGFSPVASATP